MLFNSHQYFVFFALVLAAYWSFSNNAARLRVVVAASLIFYASWNPPFVLLLLISISVDFFASRRIASQPESKKLYLWLSVCTNLGLLSTFKYGDFLLDNAATALGLVGVSWQHDPFSLILPLGISFYTFQTMSYTIDVYRGRQKPMQSLLTFATYVTFFPQLVAGPIVRASEFESQLRSARVLVAGDAYAGITRILIGLSKKVLLADWLAAIVEPVFLRPDQFSELSSLLAVYAYAFQIFFDFSGYVDIALGCALLMGYRLPENFNAPYLSPDLTSFWRRWHMTLSSWLRDYLYVPLGGNRKGRFKTYRNLLLTMLLGGLWHGASWNFVIWGAIHGVMLAAHRLWSRGRKEPRRLTLPLRVWLTFHLTCLAWIFFRCPEFETAVLMLRQIGRLLAAPGWSQGLVALGVAPALLATYALFVWLRTRLEAWRPRTPIEELGFGLLVGTCLVALSMFAAPGAEFIYFQF